MSFSVNAKYFANIIYLYILNEGMGEDFIKMHCFTN